MHICGRSREKLFRSRRLYYLVYWRLYAYRDVHQQGGPMSIDVPKSSVLSWDRDLQFGKAMRGLSLCLKIWKQSWLQQYMRAHQNCCPWSRKMTLWRQCAAFRECRLSFGATVAFDWAFVSTACLGFVFFDGCGWVRVGWVRVGWVRVGWVCVGWACLGWVRVGWLCVARVCLLFYVFEFVLCLSFFLFLFICFVEVFRSSLIFFCGFRSFRFFRWFFRSINLSSSPFIR